MPGIYKHRKVYRPRRSSATETLAKKKLSQMKRRSANAATNQKKIMTLTRAVNKLKVAEFGQKQIQRQIATAPTGLFPNDQFARLAAGFPICWCHQAIDRNTQIYQPQLDAITGVLTVNPIARWSQQPFPLINLDATSTKFDQLKYLQNNSIGVQPGYCHHSSIYNLKFNAENWRGWVEILVVSTRKQYTRQAAPDVDEFQLPTGLPGFANSCAGSPKQYSWNPLFFGVKKLKRMYFNTQDQQTLRTNPDSYVGTQVRNAKSRSHIRAQTNAEYAQPPGDPIAYVDIPLEQQDWIIIQCSNPTIATSTSYLSVTGTRTCVWRDSVGSS